MKTHKQREQEALEVKEQNRLYKLENSYPNDVITKAVKREVCIKCTSISCENLPEHLKGARDYVSNYMETHAWDSWKKLDEAINTGNKYLSSVCEKQNI